MNLEKYLADIEINIKELKIILEDEELDENFEYYKKIEIFMNKLTPIFITKSTEVFNHIKSSVKTLKVNDEFLLKRIQYLERYLTIGYYLSKHIKIYGSHNNDCYKIFNHFIVQINIIVKKILISKELLILRSEMDDKGITIRFLAEYMGYSSSALSRVFNLKKNVDIDEILFILNVLNLDKSVTIEKLNFMRVKEYELSELKEITDKTDIIIGKSNKKIDNQIFNDFFKLTTELEGLKFQEIKNDANLNEILSNMVIDSVKN